MHRFFSLVILLLFDYLQDGIYNGPKYAVDKLKEIYTEKVETVRVLDVAAGTGLLGIQLYARGFRNIDALDPSRGMLGLCNDKNVYQNLICECMSKDPSNITAGGYICIIMRKEYLTTAEEYNNNKLDDLMDQLEKGGLWQKVERTIKTHYSFKKDGVLYVYRGV